jgi:probable rRNA maturation factor
MSTDLSLSFSLEIEVANHYDGLQFSENSLRNFFFTFASLHQHSLKGSLSVAFLDGHHHSQLHGEFLKDFRPTDVITFPPDPDENMAGEICVSVDQAIEEASKRNLSFVEELSLYLIHGWLHLVGFNDLDDLERKMMRQEEKRALEVVQKHRAWPDFRLAL